MTAPHITIDPSLSVNEIIRQYPASMRVLNSFGIDTCCGGAISLREAAVENDVALTDLQQGIADALAAQAEA